MFSASLAAGVGQGVGRAVSAEVVLQWESRCRTRPVGVVVGAFFKRVCSGPGQASAMRRVPSRVRRLSCRIRLARKRLVEAIPALHSLLVHRALCRPPPPPSPSHESTRRGSPKPAGGGAASMSTTPDPHSPCNIAERGRAAFDSEERRGAPGLPSPRAPAAGPLPLPSHHPAHLQHGLFLSPPIAPRTCSTASVTPGSVAQGPVVPAAAKARAASLATRSGARRYGARPATCVVCLRPP